MESIDIKLEGMQFNKDKDIIIVDPLLVNIADLKAAGVKNIVQLRKPAWGRGKAIMLLRGGDDD